MTITGVLISFVLGAVAGFYYAKWVIFTALAMDDESTKATLERYRRGSDLVERL